MIWLNISTKVLLASPSNIEVWLQLLYEMVPFNKDTWATRLIREDYRNAVSFKYASNEALGNTTSMTIETITSSGQHSLTNTSNNPTPLHMR